MCVHICKQVLLSWLGQSSENGSSFRESQSRLVFKKCVYCINALKIQYHTTAYNSNEMYLTIGQYQFCPHWMNCLLNPKEEHILKRELIFLKIVQKWGIRRKPNPIAYSSILITTHYGTSIWVSIIPKHQLHFHYLNQCVAVYINLNYFIH